MLKLHFKPHIQKIKESHWWVCDGIIGSTPAKAYAEWRRKWRMS